MKNLTNLTTQESQIILDLLVAAFEGGSNYWYMINTDIKQYQTSGKFTEEWLKEMLAANGELEISDIETDEKLGVVNAETLQRAWKLMREEHPEHFHNAVNENWDAETADVFLQLAVIGELVFG
jgi:hypothetical protein